MFFRNLIKICITGENTERFLNMCSFHNIQLFDIQMTENNMCYANIYAQDFFQLKSIIKKSNVKVKIYQKKGISFWFQKQTKRKLFLATPFLCLLLLWASSHLLWGVRIEGNSAITNNLIEEFLQEQGIHYGMPLSKIPIYELKTNLRNKYDEITWVSIYLKGTYLQISLKERDTVNYSIPSITDSQNLIAPVAGTIESILVRQGTSKVMPGDQVEKGDILIEGNIQIPAQDGTIKEIQPCKADGDVYLVYPYTIQEIISLEHVEKKYTGKEYQKYVITFHEHLWEFPFFEVPFLRYDCITVPLEFPLLNLFSLPLAIHQTTYQDYVLIRQKYTINEAQKLAEQKLNKIILSLEEKGVQIIEKNVKIETNSAYLSLTGTFTLRENVH